MFPLGNCITIGEPNQQQQDQQRKLPPWYLLSHTVILAAHMRDLHPQKLFVSNSKPYRHVSRIIFDCNRISSFESLAVTFFLLMALNYRIFCCSMNLAM